MAITGLLVDTRISAVNPNAAEVDLITSLMGNLENGDFSFMIHNPSNVLSYHLRTAASEQSHGITAPLQTIPINSYCCEKFT